MIKLVFSRERANRARNSGETVSILETINRVREAEQEADRLIEEARAAEQQKVAEALRRRKVLLGGAVQEAERSLEEFRARLEREERDAAERIDRETEEECRQLRDLAEHNRERASAAALESFLATFVRP